MLVRPQASWSGAAAFFAALGVTVAVAADQGGFFPRTWGWATISLAALTASALILLERVPLGRLEATALALLAAVDAWTGLSSVWSAAPAESLREAERGLIYVSALLAAVVLGRGRVPELLAGVAVAVTGVSTYGLSTRLFPSHPAAFQPVEGTLLVDPLGYANALGLLAAIGFLLSLAFAAHARTAYLRAAAAAAPILLLPTLDLTASRGSWIGLAVGFGVAALLDPLRSRFLATACAVAPPAGAVLWLTTESDALTDKEATLGEAARSGHRLAVAIALLALVAAAAVLGVRRLENRFRRLQSRRLIAGVIGALAFGLAAFAALELPGHLGDRPAYWSVAWSEYAHHPWLGTGAGTFARYWRDAHPLGLGALDAHNLYLETLAELGPAGLALLTVALLLPLVPAAHVRSVRLAAAAAAAYSAFLVHAVFDWDWEMPAVTIVALFCAGAVLAAAHERGTSRPFKASARIGLLLAALALAVLALVGHIANSGTKP